MELVHRVAKGAEELTRIIGRRAQAPHQGLERLAFNILHHHIELVARATTVNDPGQMFKTPSRPLGGEQALVRPADLGRGIDAFADEGAKRPAARTLKIHNLGCFDRRAFKHAINAIAVIAVERRQVLGKRGSQLVVGICGVLSIHSVHHSAGRRHLTASAPCSFASMF